MQSNKCDICGKEFELLSHNRYSVVEEIGILMGLKALTRYNAFDCPYCGCQNRRGIFFPCASIPESAVNECKKMEEFGGEINSSHIEKEIKNG